MDRGPKGGQKTHPSGPDMLTRIEGLSVCPPIEGTLANGANQCHLFDFGFGHNTNAHKPLFLPISSHLTLFRQQRHREASEDRPES